jgi:hypothetical protein
MRACTVESLLRATAARRWGSQMKIWMRFETREEAFASAKRLVAKYGERFALVFDDMGIEGFSYPFAVVGL